MTAQKDVAIELMVKTVLLVGRRRCYIKILRVGVLVRFKISRCGAGGEKIVNPRRTQVYTEEISKIAFSSRIMLEDVNSTLASE